MVKDNGDGTFTVTKGDSGTPVVFKLQPDPNGSDRLQLLSAGNTTSESALAELEATVDGRAALRLINCGGSADVVTEPVTIANPDAGLPAWAG
jgi:hypothetical protein